MIFAILAAVLVVVGVVLFLASFVAARDAQNQELSTYKRAEAVTTRKACRWTAFGAFTLAVVVTLIALIKVVPANHAGVEVLFGRPTGRVFSEGLNFKNPLARVYEITGVQQESTYSNAVDEGEKGGPDAVVAQTKDNIDVDVDASVLWSLTLDGAAPIETYREYRTLEQVRRVLLRPVARDAIRVCMAKFDFEEARTVGREQIGQCSTSAIADKTFPFVTVRGVQIREMSGPAAIMQAIDRKAAAEQAAREAEFKQAQAEIDAETARIAAEGVANAEIERAKGIAEANRLVDQSLTPTLLQYRKYEFLSQVGNTTWVLEGDSRPDLVIPLNGLGAVPDDDQ